MSNFCGMINCIIMKPGTMFLIWAVSLSCKHYTVCYTHIRLFLSMVYHPPLSTLTSHIRVVGILPSHATLYWHKTDSNWPVVFSLIWRGSWRGPWISPISTRLNAPGNELLTSLILCCRDCIGLFFFVCCRLLTAVFFVIFSPCCRTYWFVALYMNCWIVCSLYSID